MILTVTLNAAIDRTVAVPSFRQGHRHRAVEASTVAGGKGINVARALKLLDRPVIATGLAGGPTGARLMERLAEESILTDFTWIAGESRTNLAVIDPTNGEQTEINERGPDVTAEELDRFLEKLLYLARGARICVIAGSLPPSVPAAFAARMVEELKTLDVETILDTEGEPLLDGLRAGPGRGDAERQRGRGRGGPRVQRPRGPRRRAAQPGRAGSARRRHHPRVGLRRLARGGPAPAPLRGHRSGARAGRRRSAPATPSWPASSPRASTAARPEEGLRFAVACGAESTQHFGAGTIDPSEVEAIAERVEIHNLDTPAAVR